MRLEGANKYSTVYSFNLLHPTGIRNISKTNPRNADLRLIKFNTSFQLFHGKQLPRLTEHFLWGFPCDSSQVIRSESHTNIQHRTSLRCGKIIMYVPTQLAVFIFQLRIETALISSNILFTLMFVGPCIIVITEG